MILTNGLDGYVLGLILVFCILPILIVFFCFAHYLSKTTKEERQRIKELARNPEKYRDDIEAQQFARDFAKKVFGTKLYNKLEQKQLNIRQNQNRVEDSMLHSNNLPETEYKTSRMDTLKGEEISSYTKKSFNYKDEPSYIKCPFCGVQVKKGNDICPKCKKVI
ncbi:MAG: hypothetical protein GF364_11885 [Candidatus Lokiarchaeota archaeon]|nr:hypothetical protein [Candidatus Lokiarchaeota archaeon]